MTLVIIFAFLSQLYINSAAEKWWADDAFGGRRFTGLILFLTLPLALFFAQLKQKKWLQYAVVVCALLLVWNGLSFVQYRLGLIDRSAALTLQEMTVDRILLPWTLLDRFIR